MVEADLRGTHDAMTIAGWSWDAYTGTPPVPVRLARNRRTRHPGFARACAANELFGSPCPPGDGLPALPQRSLAGQEPEHCLGIPLGVVDG